MNKTLFLAPDKNGDPCCAVCGRSSPGADVCMHHWGKRKYYLCNLMRQGIKFNHNGCMNIRTRRLKQLST